MDPYKNAHLLAKKPRLNISEPLPQTKTIVHSPNPNQNPNGNSFSSTSTCTSFQYCQTCCLSVIYSEWLSHLTSASHQVTVKETSKANGIYRGAPDNWDKKRTIHLHNCQGIEAKPLLEYVNGWGHVENFSYISKQNGSTSQCVFLLESLKVLREMTSPDVIHMIQNKRIYIKNNISVRSKNIRKAGTMELEQVGNMLGLNTTNANANANTSVGGAGVIKRENVISPPIATTASHNCPVCNVIAWTMDEWLEHLTSVAHRKLKNCQGGAGTRDWNRKNGVMFNGLAGICRKDVLKFACGWGSVLDFCYSHEGDESPHPAYVLFDSEDVVDCIIGMKEFLFIDSKKIVADVIPEFSGYSKSEKQLLRAQKLADEMLVMGSKIISEMAQTPEGLHKKEKQEIMKLLEGKELEEQIEIFLEHVSWSQEFTMAVDKIVKETLPNLMKGACHRVIRECQWTPIGQIVTGVGLKRIMTVEILLLMDEPQLPDIIVTSRLVHDIRQLLSSFEASWSLHPRKLQASWHALPHTSTSLGGEIPCVSFSTMVQGYETQFKLFLGRHHLLHLSQSSLLISLYCQLDPRVKPLLTIASYLNSYYKFLVCTDELFPNHLISIMLMFFLQQQKILPTVAQLQDEQIGISPLMINGFNCAFSKDLEAIRKHCKLSSSSSSMLSNPSIKALSVLGLFKAFLKFFAYDELDMDEFVICPKLGILVSKENFLQVNRGKLPVELREVVLNLDRPILIQDPFLLNMNLANSRGKKARFYFVRYCKIGASNLERGFREEKPSLHLAFKMDKQPRRDLNKLNESVSDKPGECSKDS